MLVLKSFPCIFILECMKQLPNRNNLEYMKSIQIIYPKGNRLMETIKEFIALGPLQIALN